MTALDSARHTPPRTQKADKGIRTLDIQLGKLTLYQLSYVRAARECIGSMAAQGSWAWCCSAQCLPIAASSIEAGVGDWRTWVGRVSIRVSAESVAGIALCPTTRFPRLS